MLLAYMAPVQAGELYQALTGGGGWLDLRYRTELVDQDNLPRHSAANTLRSRAGYATGSMHGFSALAEVEYIFHIGPERFNNGNAKGSRYPLIADPDTAELNQAALRYEGPLQTTLILGRQRVVHDNERFVGDAGFRQNMQTFDAVSLISRSVPKTELRYEYINRANRIFGRESSFGDWKMDGHAFSAAWQGWRAGKLTGYGYLFDIDPRPDLSSKTFGARWDARRIDAGGLKLKYAAEAAWQSDYGNHRGAYDAGYYLLQPSIASGPVTLTAGYEVLGSDGGQGFSTPLATLHKFQGFTDVFNTTPPSGVRDLMLDINYQRTDIAPFDVLRIWAGAHDFSAQNGGDSYGQEYYAAAAIMFRGVYTEIKGAAYEADGLGADTRKLWLTLAKEF
ncbi:MAG: hypothetical protein EXR08_07130 [Alphaproteobacteria bacterium]|nr:hypothetical protein [Alphaproteobacteria bacterium]